MPRRRAHRRRAGPALQAQAASASSVDRREFRQCAAPVAQPRAHRRFIGVGERRARRAADADFGTIAAPLARSECAADAIMLGSGARVPENTDLVVVADPRAALGAGARRRCGARLDGGGNLLWLTEPDSAADTAGWRSTCPCACCPAWPWTVPDRRALARSGFVLDHALRRQEPRAASGSPRSTRRPVRSGCSPARGHKPLLRTSAQSWTDSAIPKAGGPRRQFASNADAGEIRGRSISALPCRGCRPARPSASSIATRRLGDADYLQRLPRQRRQSAVRPAPVQLAAGRRAPSGARPRRARPQPRPEPARPGAISWASSCSCRCCCLLPAASSRRRQR